MRIASNGVVKRPGTKAFIIQSPITGNLPSLKAYMEGANGFSLYNITPPAFGDSAWEKTKKIGEYIFRRLYWTGSDQISLGNRTDALSILTEILDPNKSLNSGKGPSFICSTVAYIMIGILSAYGVVSRHIVGQCNSGERDQVIEVFIPEFNKWVWFSPYTNGYVLLPDVVTPASSLELKNYYATQKDNLLTYRSGAPDLEYNTGKSRYGTVAGSWWRGLYGGQNDTTNLQKGGYFYKCVWYIKNDHNFPVGIKSNNLTEYHVFAIDMNGSQRDAINYAIIGIDDMFPTFNTIQIQNVYADVSGMMRVEIANCMIMSCKLQTSSDGNTWTDVYSDSVFVPQIGIGSFYIRAIDTVGVPSNVIRIDY